MRIIVVKFNGNEVGGVNTQTVLSKAQPNEKDAVKNSDYKNMME